MALLEIQPIDFPSRKSRRFSQGHKKDGVSTELLASSCRRAAALFATEAVRHLLIVDGQALADKDHGLAWRIKSESAILDKLRRRRGSSGRVNDFIGIRILAIHVGVITSIEKILPCWAVDLGLRRLVRQNFFDVANESGYRALHLDYEFIAPEQINLPSSATVEVQLTTWLQHLHSALSHDVIYKAAMNCDRAKAALVLSGISSQLHEFDERIARVSERDLQLTHLDSTRLY